jgi:hypothetical protein
MATRPLRKITGHGSVRITNLKATSRALRHASPLQGGGTGSGSAAGQLGVRLVEAGEYVAQIARGKAAEWSEQIPPAIKVGGGRTGVSLKCKVGPAYPNEVPGVRHPVFGGPGTSRPDAPWVNNENRPFFAPAADEGAEGAAEIVATVINAWATEFGYS